MGSCCSNKLSVKSEEQLEEPKILPRKDFNLPAIVI